MKTVQAPGNSSSTQSVVARQSPCHECSLQIFFNVIIILFFTAFDPTFLKSKGNASILWSMFVFFPRLIEFLSKTAKGYGRQSKKNEAVARKRKSLARCSNLQGVYN